MKTECNKRRCVDRKFIDLVATKFQSSLWLPHPVLRWTLFIFLQKPKQKKRNKRCWYTRVLCMCHVYVLALRARRRQWRWQQRRLLTSLKSVCVFIIITLTVIKNSEVMAVWNFKKYHKHANRVCLFFSCPRNDTILHKAIDFS